jgi:predicted acyl esterase
MTFDPQDRRVLEIEGAMRSAEGMGDPSFPLNFHSLLGVAQGADPTDQIFSVTVDGDGVTYHSRPLDAPLTLVGEPSLRLIVVPDQPETDLCALLHEVRTDGSAILLSTDLVRMSRCSAGDAPIRVGEENLLELNGFRFVSRTLAPGSRLRLTLRSAWSSMTFPSVDFAQVPVTLIVRHGPDTTLTLPLGESR